MAADVVRLHTIQRVLTEFLQWRAPSLDPETLSSYRECLACFEKSINAHAPRALDAPERTIYRRYDIRGKGYGRQFSEVFGPEKIPREIRYFLGSAASSSVGVFDHAPTIVADLCSWLEWKGYIPEAEMEAAIDELAASEPQSSANV
jgi:hypothetical protein